jgi:two-component system chemotaxis response regulator CheY
MPLTILIADDDPIARKVLRKRLQALGYQILEAENGQLAWEVVCQQHPDIVLSDWMMPVMDGVQLCRLIKEGFDLRSTYVILVTAKDEIGDRVCALEAGADEFLTKPVDASELRARVRVGARIVEYQRTLQSLALQDSLTGLGNRRAFDTDLERLASATQRYNRSYAIVFLDVDNFKYINDTYGHGVGDIVLKAVARALQATFRTDDMIYRIGGDEFAVLLPETSDTSTILTDRLQAALVEALPPDTIPGFTDQLSMSVGVACHSPEQPLPPGALCIEADKRMYEHKRVTRARAAEREKPSEALPRIAPSGN